jgi:hypothetical protein
MESPQGTRVSRIASKSLSIEYESELQLKQDQNHGEQNSEVEAMVAVASKCGSNAASAG